MRKSWLRGVLLGVSLALLLAGGVAVAQGLFITVDKECVQCWPGQQYPTQDPYLLYVTFGGWDPQLELCQSIRINGELVDDYCATPPSEDPYSTDTGFSCEGGAWVRASVPGFDVDASQPENPLGDWLVRMWQENPPGTIVDVATVTFRVAETCEAEFVPEPGTLMLLGSGLAGLAGYAGLRWRGRK